MFAISSAFAQTASMNYVKVTTMLNAAGTNCIESVQYYDDFGREVQTVSNGISPSNRKIITHKEYDLDGRLKKTWLPIVKNGTLDYTSLSSLPSLSSSTYSDSYAYSTISYDALGRDTEATTPGNAWHQNNKHTHKLYLTNAANSVKRYRTSSGSTTLVHNGYYPAGSLSSEKTIDEDGKTLEIFTDMTGKKILERRAGCNDTYFVYDQIGHLRFVLQPGYQVDANLGRNAFQYEYDGRGNVIKKTIPGCEYIQYWYDKGGRLKFLRDSRLRQQSRYRFYLYDGLGRLCVQGTGVVGSPNNNVNTATYSVSAGYIWGGYSLTYPNEISSPQLEIVNYYDNYDFLQTLSNSPFNCDTTHLSVTSHANAHGFATGSMQRASDNNLLFNACYYDKRGNMTDSRMVLAGSRKLSTHNEYSYTNKPTSSATTLTSGSNTYTMTQTNTYDQCSDLLTAVSITPKKDSNTYAAHQIKSISYDDLGRVSQIAFPGNAGCVGYHYNLHGWLSKVNGTHFIEYLYYNDTGATPCFNGNISRIRYANYGANYGYDFTYDGLDRLTCATYGETPTLASNRNRYDTSVSYDQNGNIISLTRRGKKSSTQYGTMDNLQMTYNGNQLRKVMDTGSPPASPSQAMYFEDGANSYDEYLYDGAGALVYDANKGIAHIEYDNLGYPKEIQFTNGNTTRFVYSPDGTKLRATHITAIDGIAVPLNSTLPLAESQILAKDSTDYSGNWVFVNNKYKRYLFDDGYITYEDPRLVPLDTLIVGPNPQNVPLSEIQQEAEGAPADNILADGPIVGPPIQVLTPHFYYYTKDHLGNVRAVTNELGDVIQRTHYYPFGAIIPECSTYQSAQPYKYNGKELDRMHGLDWYDYGARNYDAILGRWDRIDPLCEKYYDISPYAYCAGNPIKYFDKFGCEPGDSFPTQNAAAIDFGKIYNAKSIEESAEYATLIYSFKNKDGKTLFSYAKPNKGTSRTSTVKGITAPKGSKFTAIAHTHASYMNLRNNGDDKFSGDQKIPTLNLKHLGDDDIGTYNENKLDGFVATPNGSLLRYNHNTGGIKRISTQMPSDKYHPHRLNNVSSRQTIPQEIAGLWNDFMRWLVK